MWTGTKAKFSKPIRTICPFPYHPSLSSTPPPPRSSRPSGIFTILTPFYLSPVSPLTTSCPLPHTADTPPPPPSPSHCPFTPHTPHASACTSTSCIHTCLTLPHCLTSLHPSHLTPLTSPPHTDFSPLTSLCPLTPCPTLLHLTHLPPTWHSSHLLFYSSHFTPSLLLTSHIPHWLTSSHTPLPPCPLHSLTRFPPTSLLTPLSTPHIPS